MGNGAVKQPEPCHIVKCCLWTAWEQPLGRAKTAFNCKGFGTASSLIKTSSCKVGLENIVKTDKLKKTLTQIKYIIYVVR